MATPPTPAGATVTQLKARGRGRPAGAPPKTHPVIPGDEFVIEDIDPDARGYLRRQRIERSKEQQAVDRKVLSIFRNWQEEGSPGDWTKMPVKGWVISKSLEEEALFMLSKGTGLHGKKLVIGSIQRRPLPDLPLPEGKVRIPFCVVNRKSKVTNLPADSPTPEKAE